MCNRLKNILDRKKITKYQDDIQKQVSEIWKNDGPILLGEIIYHNYDPSDNKKNREIVFLDALDELDWLTSYDLENDQMKLLNKITYLQCLPYKQFSIEDQKAFLRMVGNGIVAAIKKDDNGVEKCRKQAFAFHKKTSIEVNRSWTVAFSLLLLLFISIYYCLLRQWNMDNDFILAGYFGVLGTFVSIFYRNSRIFNYTASDLCTLFIETLARFVVGAISGVLFSMIADHVVDSEKITPVITIASFAAGFSEKIIPGIVSKYENKLGDED